MEDLKSFGLIVLLSIATGLLGIWFSKLGPKSPPPTQDHEHAHVGGSQ